MAIDLRRLNHRQLDELIARAERRRDELARERADTVRAKILAMVKAEGLDYADVMGGGPGRRGASPTKGRKVAPKYRNPADKAQTWSGRGRQPLWFAAALKAGKTEQQLRIR
jgi:DNA-binding protein H-NS